jgi:hypothetical protein
MNSPAGAANCPQQVKTADFVGALSSATGATQSESGRIHLPPDPTIFAGWRAAAADAETTPTSGGHARPPERRPIHDRIRRVLVPLKLTNHQEIPGLRAD